VDNRAERLAGSVQEEHHAGRQRTVDRVTAHRRGLSVVDRLVGPERLVGAEDDHERPKERALVCAGQHPRENGTERLETDGHLSDVVGRRVSRHDEVRRLDARPPRVRGGARGANQGEGGDGNENASHQNAPERVSHAQLAAVGPQPTA
jgi:hypothetical protein